MTPPTKPNDQANDRDKPPAGLPQGVGLPSQNQFVQSDREWVQLGKKVNNGKTSR